MNPVVVTRSSSSPALRPPTSDDYKRAARSTLIILAVEAREQKHTNAAREAYAADQAIGRDDCAAAQTSLARVADEVTPDDRAYGALESARRSVDSFCAMVRD